MFDSSLDRILSFRLATASDCWGNRRGLRTAARNGIWFIDAAGFDEPPAAREPEDPAAAREGLLEHFARSGHFTSIEIRTLQALVIDRLTIAEIAERDGCTRQAVVARITGNSRGQGGILKKARAFGTTSARGPSRS